MIINWQFLVKIFSILNCEQKSLMILQHDCLFRLCTRFREEDLYESLTQWIVSDSKFNVFAVFKKWFIETFLTYTYYK